MKRVMQKVVNDKDGDCFAACLATILECDVPNFHTDASAHMRDHYDTWLAPQNLQLVWFTFGSAPVPKGYSILSVKSAMFKDAMHAVVFHQDEEGSGHIIHNPNPFDPRGIEIPVEDWRFFDVVALRNPAQDAQARVKALLEAWEMFMLGLQRETSLSFMFSTVPGFRELGLSVLAIKQAALPVVAAPGADGGR